MSQAPEVDQGSTHPPLPSAPNEMNLVWIDMEMTGLNPDLDRVIELAAIVTDAELNVLAEGPVFTIHQTDQILDGMDAWNKGTHGRSGLIDRVKASTTTEEQASAQMIDFCELMSRQVSHRCVAIRFARIVVLWRVTCRH